MTKTKNILRMMLGNHTIKMSLIKKTFLMLLFVVIANKFSVAQTGIIDNTVTVVAAYEPTLSDAYKITFNPTMKDTVFEAPKLKYTIESKDINTTITLEPIKAAKVVGEPVNKLYKNLIKAGFGNYTTPYVELYANSTRSRTTSLGLHVKYLGSSGSIGDYDNSNYSDLNLDLYGKKYLKSATMDAEVFFSRNAMKYYGYDHSMNTVMNSIDNTQHYAYVGFNASYYSNYVDSNSLNHRFTLGYSHLADNYSYGENNVKLKIDVDQSFKLFKATDRQTIGLKADVDFYNNSGATISTANNALIKLLPYISTHYNEYMFLAALNVSFTTGSVSKIYIYPVIEGSLAVVPKVLKAFAGIKGEVTRNSFKSITDVNPFVESSVPMGYSSNKFEFYGGINSSLTKTIDFTARLSNKYIDGMPLFVNDTNVASMNRFTIVYDNVNVFNINSELQWRYDDKFTILIKGNWNQYSAKNETEAWHKPSLDATLSFYYNINNKIITHADIFAFDKMYARTFVANKVVSQEISGMIDFNLGIEYRLTKIFSAFLNLNNLTAMRYSYWYNYPNQRFNMMAGLTYAF